MNSRVFQHYFIKNLIKTEILTIITAKMATNCVVILRHGESEFNKLNIFCGWHDAPLSEKGK